MVNPLSLANLAEHLGDDEIHVWWLAYRTSEGRMPLRRVLAAYLDTDIEQVDLVDDEHGRPQLSGEHAGLGFNWSHSGQRALIAVGREVLPGIDMELVGRRTRALELARRYFGPEEITYLEGLPEARRGAAFLDLWTAKEAVLKAVGRGIAFGLDRLRINLTEGQLRLVHLDGDDSTAWRLHRLHINDDVTAALAWRGAERRVRIGHLDPGN